MNEPPIQREPNPIKWPDGCALLSVAVLLLGFLIAITQKPPPPEAYDSGDDGLLASLAGIGCIFAGLFFALLSFALRGSSRTAGIGLFLSLLPLLILLLDVIFH